MFTNVDVRGVPRGRCGWEHCECDGFTRSCTGAYGGAGGWVQCGWCCYCGHPPVNHSRIERNVFGRQEILPVIWNGAYPQMLDPPTRSEWKSMLEAAQPTTDEVVLEPEEEVRKTAAPENEMPEVIVLPAEKERSDQDLGLKRKHCVEDAPNLDTSTLENSDLLRKVENLENEIEELKKCQNKEGMPSRVVLAFPWYLCKDMCRWHTNCSLQEVPAACWESPHAQDPDQWFLWYEVSIEVYLKFL
ncbi:uncharacterized protein LOC119402245 [Rhipicephalus sanguineus]|uniref:uncharacterized protein LOC119402245 n=1 Tax=Rhipicephalus sanguineus TaxID=34632 RepID=UPI0020C469A4|nr:uncharacterized protein LOC119402245 [Rhipicephalus sanguineus]